MARLLYAPTTANVDHVSSVTETTWASWVIPANTLGSSGAVRFEIVADILNNTGAGDTFTLRIKYGATTMFADLTVGFGTDAARRPVRLLCTLAADGATNAQILSGTLITGPLTATTSGTGDLIGTLAGAGGLAIGGTSAEDSTAAKTLAVTVQNTTNSANYSVRLLEAYIEVL